MPSGADVALLDAPTCSHSFGNARCGSFSGVESSVSEGV